MCRTQLDSSCEGRQACPLKPLRTVKEVGGENVGLIGSAQSRQAARAPDLFFKSCNDYRYFFLLVSK